MDFVSSNIYAYKLDPFCHMLNDDFFSGGLMDSLWFVIDSLSSFTCVEAGEARHLQVHAI